jgi:hypothetical protein
MAEGGVGLTTEARGHRDGTEKGIGGNRGASRPGFAYGGDRGKAALAEGAFTPFQQRTRAPRCNPSRRALSQRQSS